MSSLVKPGIFSARNRKKPRIFPQISLGKGLNIQKRWSKPKHRKVTTDTCFFQGIFKHWRVRSIHITILDHPPWLDNSLGTSWRRTWASRGQFFRAEKRVEVAEDSAKLDDLEMKQIFYREKKSEFTLHSWLSWAFSWASGWNPSLATCCVTSCDSQGPKTTCWLWLGKWLMNPLSIDVFTLNHS